MLLICGFEVLRERMPGPSKSDVIIRNVLSSKRNFVTSKCVIICRGSGVFETFAGNLPSHAIIGTRKKFFLKHFLPTFWVTGSFYAMIVIKHGFLIHLHLLGPEGGVETWAWKHMSRAMRKCVLCHMRTTKAQISLISAFVVHCLDSNISRFYSRTFITVASFCGCAGRFVSGLVGNSRRHVLSCRGSYVNL